MQFVVLGVFAGVVVFGLLFIIMGLKGGPWKLPGIGMAVCFIAVVALGVMAFLGFGPFSGPAADGDADPSGGEGDPGTLEGVDVDTGLFNVTLNIPADYVDAGTTQEQLDDTVKEKGFKSATLNEDGSVTYVITKTQHEEMMDGISQTIEESLAEMVDSDEYPRIVKIEANSDYTQYKAYLSAEEVGLSESMAAYGFYILSATYHVFNGTDPDNVNIQYISEATGEVIQEANSRDIG